MLVPTKLLLACALIQLASGLVHTHIYNIYTNAIVGQTVTTAWATHTPNTGWMWGYKGRNEVGCCDVYDCAETTIAYLGETENGEKIVLVGDTELTLPHAWVHASRDNHGYWCFVATGQPEYRDANNVRRAVPPTHISKENTRCVFYVSIN